jgi:protein SCO1/2
LHRFAQSLTLHLRMQRSARATAFAALACVVLLVPLAARATIDTKAALARSGAVLGTTPADRVFANASGETVHLADFRGRPLVVNLVYTSCPHVCPTVTANLKRAADVATRMLGTGSFRVATIGFDAPTDTPERMAAYARERGIDSPDWTFLAADPATLAALVDELGFTYVRSGGGIEHMTQVTLLDADGRVYRQIYGADLEVPAVVEPLKQLATGARFEVASVASIVDGIRLVCSVYDPATGRYRFNYAIVVTVLTGLLALGGFGVFVVRMWRHA